MPRMPNPTITPVESDNTHISWNSETLTKNSHESRDSAVENLKLKVLEDHLREDLTPKDILILKELSKIPDDSFIYIYDGEKDRLKRISTENLHEIILQEVDIHLEEKNTLNYKLVNKLPPISEAVSNTLYLVPADPVLQNKRDKDIYNEYLFVKETQSFERFGMVEINMSNYRTAKEQDILNAALEDMLLRKITEHTTDFNNPHHVTKEQLGVHDDPELFFESYYEFPSIGKEGMLYIATDEQITYYYKDGHYVALKGAVPDIDIINCGGAE